MKSKKLAFIKNGNVIGEYVQLSQNVDLNMSDGEICYLKEILNVGQPHEKLIIGLSDSYSGKIENSIRFLTLSNRSKNKIVLFLKKMFNTILIFLNLIRYRADLVVVISAIDDIIGPFFYSKLFNKKFIPAIAASVFQRKGTIHNKLIIKLALRCLKDNLVTLILSRGKYVKKELVSARIDKRIREYYPRYTDNFFKEYEVENLMRDEVFKVIFVGRISSAKGIFKLLEVANNLKKKHYNIRFIIIGTGPEKQNLINKIKSNSLESHVFYLGYRSNNMIYSYLKHANILFIPTNYESVCKVSLEGILSEIPMIVSNVGDLPLNIEDSVTGFVLDKDDILGFTNKIIKVFENKELENYFRKNLKIKRREVVKWNITFEKILSDFITKEMSYS